MVAGGATTGHARRTPPSRVAPWKGARSERAAIRSRKPQSILLSTLRVATHRVVASVIPGLPLRFTPG